MFNFFNKTEKVETSNTNQSNTEQTIAEPLAFREDLRTKWKELSDKKELSASDMAALHIYRAVIKGEGIEGAKVRLMKAFRPIKNEKKLANGFRAWGSYKDALHCIGYQGYRWDPIKNKSYQAWIYCTFASWLNEAEIKAVLELAAELKKESL